MEGNRNRICSSEEDEEDENEEEVKSNINKLLRVFQARKSSESEQDVDSERARGGNEVARRICSWKENHSQKRPFPWLPEQAIASEYRRSSQLSSGFCYLSSLPLRFYHFCNSF